MERNVVWQPWNEAGIEHLRVVEEPDGAVADNFLIRVFGNRPVRMRYRIRVDPSWCVREVDVDLWSPDHLSVNLRSDGQESWVDGDGNALPHLAGCIDVDLTATAFTNTLAIRRLDLAPGGAEEIDVVYIRVPELSIEAVKQRYTCLERHADDARYRYEGLSTGYRTELDVDDAGFVIDYPNNFRRVLPD